MINNKDIKLPKLKFILTYSMLQLLKGLTMFKIFTLFILLTLFAYSNDIIGIGFGKNIKEAKYEALSDLSYSIKTDVHSKFVTYKTQSDDKTNSKSTSEIIISSNLPILGAKFELFDNTDNVEATVTLSPKNVKKLYISKLDSLTKEIKELKNEITKTKDTYLKEKLLNEILNKLNEFERYYTVSIVMDINYINKINITKESIENKLLNLHHNLNSIELASKYLAKTFKNYKNIYLYPPKIKNSHEITPFAKAFSLHVKPYINTTNIKKAKFKLIGEYIYSNSGLIISYDLIDSKTHKNKISKTITLKPKAYEKYRIEPKNIDFDKLLHNGVIYSKSLRASISTNKGTDNLLFNKGEEIELLIKFNKMAYYYIIGYTQTNGIKHSYLLELNEGIGKDKFIGFVNADDINHWISIGSFIIKAPFGIESIQLIASNKRITTLPKYYYDKKTSYYIIGENPQDALLLTRGLIRKKNKKQEVSEAVLLFTTSK